MNATFDTPVQMNNSAIFEARTGDVRIDGDFHIEGELIVIGDVMIHGFSKFAGDGRPRFNQIYRHSKEKDVKNGDTEGQLFGK